MDNLLAGMPKKFWWMLLGVITAAIIAAKIIVALAKFIAIKNPEDKEGKTE
jgi:hypothetical protein